MNPFDDFSFSRKTLSSYYIASLISILLFRLINGQIIRWSNFVGKMISSAFENPIDSVGESWLVFVFSCFIITLLIRRIIIQPLGMYIKEEDAPGWELLILFILVFGSYLYNLNQIFTQPMPTWVPGFLVRLVDGVKVGEAQLIPWFFVPWLWDLGPILFMFTRTKMNIQLDGG